MSGHQPGSPAQTHAYFWCLSGLTGRLNSNKLAEQQDSGKVSTQHAVLLVGACHARNLGGCQNVNTGTGQGNNSPQLHLS